MKHNIKYLKKRIIYKCSYSGVKETDILYKKIFLNRINDFTYTDLNQISDLFMNLSDPEIFIILSGKKDPPIKFKNLFNKLMNA